MSPEDKFHDLQSLTPSYALLPVSPNSPIPYSGDATTPSSHPNRRRKPVASRIVGPAPAANANGSVQTGLSKVPPC